ncbi:MAG: class I SAM-dependent methyltransferase [Kiritimatiellae bacterium]|nr:class I SAM-dependent methyltransferase [Kiritimatiellia bacterium]
MEVGAGSGRFAARLGIKTGVEPSEMMAVKARARGVTILSGTAEALPFPEGCFDFVLLVTTLCFVDDPSKALGEAFRVLKSEGEIIIGFIDRESELGQKYSKTRASSRFYADATFFSSCEVQQHLQTSGFKTTKILQALIPGESPALILEGFGKGAFVAIKALKQSLLYRLSVSGVAAKREDGSLLQSGLVRC